MKWLYMAFYPESFSYRLQKSSENRISVTGTYLQSQGGKTILRIKVQSVGLFVILL